MDTATAIGSVLAAFGLSGAAGLNAWLPLFGSALLDRLDVVELAAPFDELSTTPALVTLGVLFLLDFVGDKVPTLDHALHVVGMVVAPASGAVLFTGQTGVETELPTAVTLALGALTAGSAHAGRATVRPGATVATAGFGNPVVSLVEDVASAVLTVLAFLLPVVAFVLVACLIGAMLFGGRRLARVLGDRRPREGGTSRARRGNTYP